jgi:LacI family transcriptional regulator
VTFCTEYFTSKRDNMTRTINKPIKTAKQIDKLRASIRNGKLRPGEMIGTELAFTEQWKLSRTAVRNGIDQLIDEGLIERRPGKGLYVRSPTSETRVVQVIVPILSWEFMSQIAAGAQAEARTRGIQIQICDARGQMDYDLDVIRALPEGNTVGAIIVSLHHNKFSEVLYGLKAACYPFVVADQQFRDIDVPSIEHDNYAGGYIVGQKVIELGHTKAVFVGPLEIIKRRLDGFREAFLDAGVIFNRAMAIDLGGAGGVTDWFAHIASTEERFVEMLSSPNRPTVIFDGSGDLAPFIYRAARRVGLEIPTDISVVTFDDAPFATYLYPEVARLQHSWPEMGRIALEMLFKQIDEIDNGKIADTEHNVLPVNWLPAPSLGPPPK